MKLKLVISLWCVLQYSFVSSQENMGSVHSNFVPTNSILLNPSSSSDSKVFIDLNIAGLSLFGHNDYVYANGGLLSLNRTSQNGGQITEQYNTSNAPYGAYVDVNVHGPSLSVSYGKFGVGLYTGYRSVTSVNGIPNHLTNHLVNGFSHLPQQGQEFTTTNARIGTLNWLEYGLNLSYVFKQSGTDMLSAGATFKLLNGSAGAGLNIQEWNYEVLNDSILNSYELRGRYGLSDLDTDNPGASSFLGNGSGLGVDLGFNYKKMKKGVQGYEPHTPSGCTLKDYDYKLGFSLLDLGRIKMKSGYYREFDLQDTINWEDYNGADPDNIASVDALVNQELLNFGASAEDTQFKMLLPSAFSAQFDYNIGYGFYANATWVQGFNRKRRLGVERASTIAITPRFESKPFDLGIPISIHDYQSARVGLAFRVYYLVIGTDNLFSIIGKGDTYGTDFYFNLKYTMFKPWYCSDKKVRTKNRVRRGKSGGTPPCPSW